MFDENKMQMCCGKMHKPAKIIFAILMGLTLLSLIAFLSASTQYKNKLSDNIDVKNTITVSGTGEIYTKPDLAMVSFSVTNEASTVDKAVGQNTEKMNAVIKAVKEQGVKDEDVKTTDFYVYPRYEYQKSETEIYSYPPQKRVLVGYEVRQSLEVKIRDLSKIGAIIETGTSSGANEVGGLQMKVDKEEEFQKQARGQAIDNAKEKAKELAKQIGVKLGKISSFSDSTSPVDMYSATKSSVPPGMGIGGAESADIQTGQNKITSNVSITYEIE